MPDKDNLHTGETDGQEERRSDEYLQRAGYRRRIAALAAGTFLILAVILVRLMLWQLGARGDTDLQNTDPAPSFSEHSARGGSNALERAENGSFGLQSVNLL